MALIEEVDGDFVRDLLACAAERVMEAEVQVRTAASAGQRSPDRLTLRISLPRT